MIENGRVERGFSVIKQFLVNERGSTAIEYGLIAALIVIVIIAGITAVGNATILQLGNIADKL